MRPVAHLADPTPGAYWEPRLDAFVLNVQPGGFRVTRQGELVLGTLLGSCVSACISDPVAGVGGLNHFLLPDDRGAPGPAGQAARYGVHAMEVLINEVLKQGGARGRLEAKLFGGANVLALSGTDTVGERNRRFTLDFLGREGIPVTAHDLGGARARRVFFRPAANQVLVQVLGADDAEQVRREEVRLSRRASAQPSSGGVELF